MTNSKNIKALVAVILVVAIAVSGLIALFACNGAKTWHKNGVCLVAQNRPNSYTVELMNKYLFTSGSYGSAESTGKCGAYRYTIDGKDKLVINVDTSNADSVNSLSLVNDTVTWTLKDGVLIFHANGTNRPVDATSWVSKANGAASVLCVSRDDGTGMNPFSGNPYITTIVFDEGVWIGAIGALIAEIPNVKLVVSAHSPITFDPNLMCHTNITFIGGAGTLEHFAEANNRSWTGVNESGTVVVFGNTLKETTIKHRYVASFGAPHMNGLIGNNDYGRSCAEIYADFLADAKAQLIANDQYLNAEAKAVIKPLLDACGLSSTETPAPVAPVESAPTPKFTDVPADAYYAAPVAWAVGRGITAGTSGSTFSPSDTCTTAQVLTFLYRAAGSPAPMIANPFSNLTGSEYYANAAIWAYEKGMVSGSVFDGSTPCTRSATVTYMWQYAGSPQMTCSDKFTDVDANCAYAQAVEWALENNVTSGSSATTFSPGDTCTRGQIVTFLYRGLAN